MVAIVLASVLLITPILLSAFCIFKRRQTQQRVHRDVQHTDLNPEYGNYEDPDPIVEVVDTNDYYFSDYEVGSGRSVIRDNNPYYE